VSRYQQFFEFNVFFVFITSLGLLLFSNVVSQVFIFLNGPFPWFFLLFTLQDNFICYVIEGKASMSLME
jgi:hypothetical protein